MARRMKVLSLIHDISYGGPETRMLCFANAHDRTRVDHHIATIHQPDRAMDANCGPMRQEYMHAGLEIVNLGKRHFETRTTSLMPGEILRTLKSLRRVVGGLRRYIRKHQIDLIDAHLSTANFIGVLAARLSGIPACVTYYSIESPEAILQRAVRQAFSILADTMITDSDDCRKRLEHATMWPGARVVVIRNGIAKPKVNRSREEVRTELGLPMDPATRVICQVSRLVEYKGNMVHLQAAQKVLKAEPNTAFLFVGYDGGSGFRKKLEDQAASLGISNRVRITGYPGSIGDIWNAVDIHGHASLLDSLPIAITEGMSFAMPAVVTATGGIPELVTHEETGLVVFPNDPDVFASALLRLLRNSQDASRLGRAAYRRYDEQYRPEVMAKNMEELFEMLISRRTKRR